MRTEGPGDRPGANADLTMADGQRVLRLTRDRSLTLPPVAESGAAIVSAAVAGALAGCPGAVAGGLIPFDPAVPPDLFVCARPQWQVEPILPASVRLGAGPSARPPRAEPDDRYIAAVAEALGRIDAGDLRKVVLARSVDVALAGDHDVMIDAVWQRLRTRGGGHGYAFIARSGGSALVGNSPELVAEVSATGFASHPLAGSARRDPDPELDARSRALLLGSDKDRREHRYVVDHIVRRLDPLAERLDAPPDPSIHATDTMAHLGTRITGRLLPGIGSLHAALAIHPTPAVCGTPSLAALQAIRELEPQPRGAYAGLVGWTDGRGHGCWALALRCAEFTPGRARLFAGAGIVAGSRPDAEHAETEAKFGTMLAAIGDVGQPGSDPRDLSAPALGVTPAAIRIDLPTTNFRS